MDENGIDSLISLGLIIIYSEKITTFTKAKLEFHIMILYLAINDYVIPNVVHLAHDFKMPASDLASRFIQIGCSVTRVEDNIEAKLGSGPLVLKQATRRGRR